MRTLINYDIIFTSQGFMGSGVVQKSLTSKDRRVLDNGIVVIALFQNPQFPFQIPLLLQNFRSTLALQVSVNNVSMTEFVQYLDLSDTVDFIQYMYMLGYYYHVIL